MPIYEVERIHTTPQDFKPDPSLGNYRFQDDIFDDTLENSIRSYIFETLDLPVTKINQTDEVRYSIRGVISTPVATKQPAPAGFPEPDAIIGGSDTVPAFSGPPIPGSANTARLDDETVPEPNSLTDLIQVHTTTSQPFTTTERNNPTEKDEGLRCRPRILFARG